MSSNWDGVRYNIYTPHHDGGILQFASGAAGVLATLGEDVDDVSQKWKLNPTGEHSAYSIGNWGFGTYASAGDPEIQSAFEPRTWYLAPQGYGINGLICTDAICSLVWAPLSQVDPSQAESNDVVLVAPSGASYELWEFIAVGYATSGPVPTTSTSNQPVDTTVTPGSLQALESCPPCGSSQCTFTPSDDPTSSTYSVLIGQSVANCNPGSQESATTKFGGAYELEQSFSVEVTSGAGLGFLGPSIATTFATGNKTRIESAQEIEVTIRPGQIGGLVANITYVTTPGRIRTDSRTLAFVSVQPENVLGYSVVYENCGSQFPAFTLPKVVCSGTTATPRLYLCLSLLIIGSLIPLF